ncbi:MAG: ABC-three component system middle component 1, partial [Dehalobacterium sp.]
MFDASQIERAGLIYNDKIEVLNEFLFEADYLDEDSVISRYYIYPISLEKFLLISKNDETYRQFETRYIEPIFMDIDGDLSWNLYLVFLLTNSDYEDITNENKVIIESSKEYARKLVISETEFYNFIPVGKINNIATDVDLADPLLEWTQILKEDELEFCLEKFSKKKVDSFIAGNRVDLPQ